MMLNAFPFTDAGFVAFNRHYVERLAARGIFREEVKPGCPLERIF
jgi:hypothetical protein